MDNDVSELKKPDVIPVELFNFRGNRTTDLINNQSIENELVGKLRDYKFEFLEPVFISSIIVNTSGYSNFATLYFEIHRNDGQETQQISEVSEDVFLINVGQFANGFTFRPSVSHSFFSPKTVKSIEVRGYRRDSFSELESALVNLEGFDEKIRKREQDLDQRQSEFDTKISELERQVKELSENKNELSAQIAGETSTLQKQKSEREQLQKAIKAFPHYVDTYPAALK
ncbi:MAG: hypothetical protein GY952_00730 [Rhodobacteraceae bacterium]|nr:hypothetical protein [Paracoccaceae bacterium]